MSSSDSGEKAPSVWAWVPGVLLAVALALTAHRLSALLGALLLRAQGLDPQNRPSPVSAISTAVIMGLLVANFIGVNSVFKPGLDVAMKKLLRLGIVLVGLKLSIVDVLKLGALGLPAVLAVVFVGIAVTLFWASRLKVTPSLGALAAASTSVCGITAALAVAPVVEADEREVAYTVANVTLFGLFGMLVYPYLAHALFAASPAAAGLFLGTAIHDTSQVMGAALSYSALFEAPRATEVATVAKLIRNALLVAVVPILALVHARATAQNKKRVPLKKLFPLFVLGFVAMSLLRTSADLAVGAGWLSGVRVTDAVKVLGEQLAPLLLGTALAAVGLSTRLSTLRGLGVRPFFLGFGAAAAVSALSLALALGLGTHL